MECMARALCIEFGLPSIDRERGTHGQVEVVKHDVAHVSMLLALYTNREQAIKPIEDRLPRQVEGTAVDMTS